MRCVGGLQIPIPVKGYWTDTRASSYDPSLIMEVYRCPRGTCGGGVTTNLSAVSQSSERRRRRRRLGAEGNTEGTCWELGSLNSSRSYCDSDALRGCDEGSTGPLCGACRSKYKYSGNLRTCVPCRDSAAWYEAFGIVVAAAVALWVAFLARSGEVEACGRTWHIPLVKILAKIDSGLLKVLWASYQIVVSISWSLSVTFPEPVSTRL